jgi:hypothetical protein
VPRSSSPGTSSPIPCWFRLIPCSRICADTLRDFSWECTYSLVFKRDIADGGRGDQDLHPTSSAIQDRPPSSPKRHSPGHAAGSVRSSGDANNSQRRGVRGDLKRHVRIRSLPLTFNISEQEVKIILNFINHTIAVVPLLQQRLNIKPANVKEVVSQVQLQARLDKFRSFAKSLLAVGDINEKKLRELYEPMLTSLHFLTSEARLQMDQILKWYDCSRLSSTSTAAFERVHHDLFFKSKVLEKGPVALKVGAINSS